MTLVTRAEEVRDETTLRANTATRVGGLLKDIAENTPIGQWRDELGDITKIKKVISFSPKANIDEIIVRTTEYFKG